MVLWFSRSPANVRDGWCVLQKPSQCEGWLMRSPEAQPMWGMADAFPRRQRMWGASWYFTYTNYQCPWLLIIDYCYFKLYTTTLHHYSSLIIATPGHALLHYITTYHWLFLPWAMYWYIMIKTITHAVPDWYLQLTTILPIAQEHTAKKASTSIYRASKERDTLR